MLAGSKLYGRRDLSELASIFSGTSNKQSDLTLRPLFRESCYQVWCDVLSRAVLLECPGKCAVSAARDAADRDIGTAPVRSHGEMRGEVVSNKWPPLLGRRSHHSALRSTGACWILNTLESIRGKEGGQAYIGLRGSATWTDWSG